MSNLDANPLKLREIILNTRKPLVLKDFQHNWTCFQGGLEEWCRNYDKSIGNPTNFERLSKNDSDEPQWERKRQLIQMTAIEFLKEHSTECDYWSGLNYKRRHELPTECSKGIDFSCFGFTQATEDCTMWLSSTGANTPCHYDTYGCNIVVQVYGRQVN